MMMLQALVPPPRLFWGNMSAISSIGNLIKSITQRLQGKPQGGAGQKAQAVAPQNEGDEPDVSAEVDSILAVNPPTGRWIAYAFAILAVGTVGAYYLWKWRKPADFMPSSNYATYAGLFIMALAIERILEPFSGLFIPGMKRKKAASRATAARARRAQTAATGSGTHAAVVVPVGQARKAAAAQQAVTAQKTAAAQKVATAQKAAAVAQTDHHLTQAGRAVLMWATASVLAMLVCAFLGIFLLRSVETPTPSPAKAGTTSSAPSTAKDPNRMLDLLVTGLVVGAGTKPLHDLVSQIQTSSGSSKAKASSPTTTG
jgi:hypothetical protein